MKKIILAAIGLFLFLILGVLFFVYQGIYLPKDSQGEEVSILIERGETVSSVAKKLREEGVIKSDIFFIIYGTFSEEGKNIKPGQHIVSSAMNVPEIFRKIIVFDANRVTVVEGWNLRDIAQFLEEAGYGEKDEFFRLAGKPPFYDGESLLEEAPREMALDDDFFDKPEDVVTLEGYLFPDTYFISVGTSMEEIVSTFLNNFKKKLSGEALDMVRDSEHSLHEIITIASLIEKEVFLPEDKRIVSGIIQKRMDIGMRLQMDATITYLTGRRSVRIPITETRIDSPYNTYVYEGLPKGPICNPGIDSIMAALSPKETGYLYYLSKPTGETVFSKTHEEHVRAKNRYLR